MADEKDKPGPQPGLAINERLPETTSVYEMFAELKESMGRLDARSQYLESGLTEVRHDIRDIRTDLATKVGTGQFWTGIGLVIALTSLIVGVLFSLLDK